MLKSPSKFMSRSRLKKIVEGETLAACGREYCQEEARKLLIEKETRAAHREFDKQLQSKKSEINFDSVKAFQDSLISVQQLGVRRLCQKVLPHKPWLARRMRTNPTFAEKIFWERVRCKKLGVKFRRQAIVLGWIVDFYCPSLKLIIEIDGKVHAARASEDQKRDRIIFQRTGLRTLRISNRDVIYRMDQIVDVLKFGDHKNLLKISSQ